MREHWLEHAHGRIASGDDELDVLADYGWVQITKKERKAISFAADHFGAFKNQADTLRKLLERLK